MNIIVGAWGQPKKFNLPDSSQDKSEDDKAPPKSSRCEELTDRQQIDDGRKR
jgi:hypothetical protein